MSPQNWTPTNKPCCTVDSIMLIFGPDNACGEGLPDYFTLEEGGTFVADVETWVQFMV